MLAAAGASIEERDKQGYTPLLLAAMSHPETMLWLLEQGADPEARARGGYTLLMSAAFTPACLELAFAALGPSSLEERANGGVTPLLFAIQDGDEAGALALLALGANPRASDWDGNGAIIACSSCESPDFLETLIKAGADPLAVSHDGVNALLAHARSGRSAQARRLIELGCDPNASCPDGYRPLSHALFRKDIELAEALVKAGARVDFLDTRKRNLQESVKSAYGESGADQLKDAIQYLARVAEATDIKKGMAPPDPARACAGSPRL